METAAVVVVIAVLALLFLVKAGGDIIDTHPQLPQTLAILLIIIAVGTLVVALIHAYNISAFKAARLRNREHRQYGQQIETLRVTAASPVFPAWEVFLEAFAKRHSYDLAQARLTPLIEPLRILLLSIIARSYRVRFFGKLPTDQNALEHLAALTANPQDALNRFTETASKMAVNYTRIMPEAAHLGPDMEERPAPFLIDIFNIIPTNTLVDAISQPFHAEDLFRHVPETTTDTLTPLYHANVPFGVLDDEKRFEHEWIVAPQGTGKTTLIEALIHCDLSRVAKGEASVFVMDSQNEMIPKLATLPIFHKGGALEGKLIVLEPNQKYPLALNIFDNQLDGVDEMDADAREMLYTTSLEMAHFVMAGLLGADLTAKQGGIFRYIIQGLQAIPDATILTFKEMLTPEGYAKHREHILAGHDEYVVDFFETRFNHKDYTSTKQEIFWRLDTIMANTTFRSMFSHPRNKFNLFEEMQSGKVICINTNMAILGPDGTEIFGRYFLAMLIRATQRRMLMPKSKRLPTFCYIDECQDYIANEPKIASLIDKARKQFVSLTFANQRCNNIPNSNVLDALFHTGVKYIAQNKTETATLAKLMRLEPEQLLDMPKHSFYFNSGGKSTLVSTKPPEDGPVASLEEQAAFKAEMRERYSEPAQQRSRPKTAPPRQPKPAEAADFENGPIIDLEVVDPIRDGNINVKPQKKPPSRLPRPTKPEESDAPSEW